MGRDSGRLAAGSTAGFGLRRASAERPRGQGGRGGRGRARARRRRHSLPPMTEASDAIPVFTTPEEAYAGTVYGAEFADRARNAAAVFEKRFGTAPSHVVRAPGRVNLIGEHIDYHGYSVLPMAIEHDVIVAVGRRPRADTVAVSNTNASYEARELPADPSADVAAEHHWTSYFHCGYKGAFLLSGAKPLPAPPDGMAAVVDGRVPPAAGLSSSSAVVVAAGLATAAAHGISVTRTALADFTRSAEYVIPPAPPPPLPAARCPPQCLTGALVPRACGVQALRGHHERRYGPGDLGPRGAWRGAIHLLQPTACRLCTGATALRGASRRPGLFGRGKRMVTRPPCSSRSSCRPASSSSSPTRWPRPRRPRLR